MNKLLTLAAAIGMAAIIGGPATAFHPAPDRYEVGRVQPFVGLVCKTQPPAEHIFKVWENIGAEQARKIYQTYQRADECRFFRTYEAYFIERLDIMKARNFNGKMQTVILFSIAPTEDSELVDFLVTWENLDTPV